MSAVTVHHGDSRDVLKGIPDASVDACVCDPPYALVSIGKRFGKAGSAPAKSEGASGAYARASAGFMGQQWDTGETAFDPEFWAEVLRVLKPGAHIVAFSGTRTYHRLACAIEDAGFEIRDMVAWLYGSGFPKSHDVSKGIDKAKGSIRAVVSQGAPVKRMIPGAAQNKAGWAKDSGREFIPSVTAAGCDEAAQWEGWGTALKPALEPVVLARKPLAGTVAGNVLEHGTGAVNIAGCRVGDDAATQGRWPANLAHDGSAEVVEAFPAEAGAFAAVRGTEPSNAITNVYGERARVATHHHGDSGSAARFFYTAKADAEDRLGSKHPTVKPVDLMGWLCRLVTPPGGVILDPFAGTGTTGLAAIREGFDCILIEREAQFVADINRRLAWARGEGRLTVLEKARSVDEARAAGADLPLFGGEAA